MVEVLVKRTVAVNRPAREAVSLLQNVALLAWYEPKVDSISVKRATPQSGEFSVQGHVAGLPWSGLFSYALHRQGFRSQMREGPRGVSLSGGFVVKPESLESCAITHYERYEFSGWLRPFAPLLRLYLARSIKQEVRNLAKLIEAASGVKGTGGANAKTANPCAPLFSRICSILNGNLSGTGLLLGLT